MISEYGTSAYLALLGGKHMEMLPWKPRACLGCSARKAVASTEVSPPDVGAYIKTPKDVDVRYHIDSVHRCAKGRAAGGCVSSEPRRPQGPETTPY